VRPLSCRPHAARGPHFMAREPIVAHAYTF